MARTGNHSVDRGYAWVVLASCFILRFLVEGFWASAGIMFLQWGLYFDVSAAKTAGLGSILMMLIFCSTKIASALGDRFTYRVVTILGGIIITSTLFAMSLANQLWQLYIFMPLLGVGMGLAYQASNVAYIPFFDKHFALANGIAASSCGLGFIAISPLIKLLVSSYGLNGALQIASAVMANVCVMGFILRPFNPCINYKMSTGTKDTHFSSKIGPCAGCLQRTSTCLDLHLFNKVRFVFQSVINGFLWGGLQAFILNIYPFAVSIGVPHLESSFILSVVGISMLVARLIPLGVLVDRKYISAAALSGVAILIAGADMILFTFMTTFKMLCVLAGIYGSATGIGGSFIMVVIAYSGGSKDDASGAVSWMLVSCGIGNLLWIYGCGYLYDLSGSLRLPMILCGVLVLGIAVNLLLDPLLQRWQEVLDRRKYPEDVETEYAKVSFKNRKI